MNGFRTVNALPQKYYITYFRINKCSVSLDFAFSDFSSEVSNRRNEASKFCQLVENNLGFGNLWWLLGLIQLTLFLPLLVFHRSRNIRAGKKRVFCYNRAKVVKFSRFFLLPSFVYLVWWYKSWIIIKWILQERTVNWKIN